MKIGKMKIWQVGSLLRTIYKNPEITRMELSERLGISKSVTIRLINALIEQDWIVQSGNKAKKIPLILNEKKVVCAGIEFRPHFQSLVICDLAGNILLKKRWKEDVVDFQEFIEGPIFDILEGLITGIQAIGLALPGVCDQDSRELVCSSPLEIWSPYKVPSHFKNSEWPVFFENDTRCGGWDRIAFEREKEDFIFVLSEFLEYEEPQDTFLSTSIGSAIFLDQQAYRGKNFAAGEYRTIIHQENKRSGQSYIPKEKRIYIKSDFKLREEFIDELAFHMAYITNYLDVKKIYIAGSLEGYKSEVERSLKTKILDNSIYPQHQKPQIVYPNFNMFSVARGAAGFAFEQLFAEPRFETSQTFYRKIVSTLAG